MPPGRSRSWKTSASALAIAASLLPGSGVALDAQAPGFTRGGGGMSTARVTSPTVVMSWTSHENYADGSTTTLLVLWRGTPGWFSRGGRGGASGGSSGGGAGGSGSYDYQYFTEGGLTFMMEFDYDKRIVKLLNREISLKETNVLLVDSVDSTNGPTIVGERWIEPGPPAPPVVPGAVPDPIAGIISRTPELFEYLRCGERLPDIAPPGMNQMLAFLCARMRPQ
jgi:hypothetical protein